MEVAAAGTIPLQPNYEAVAASLFDALGPLAEWARYDLVHEFAHHHHHDHLWGYHRPTGW